ncbi:hypothetical protein HBNXNv_0797 [Candidatus Nanohalovita haloferacivicina]|nr:hypothetical protein HBNXNv_0797 [Candidatus Nanohalobia archaeon BNXNv]
MTSLITEFKNSSESANNGPKHQLTVRFTSRQIRKIEKLSRNSNISLAESCRRIVSEGLKQRGERFHG